MFGFMTVDTNSLNDEQQDRYKQVYCGLCHTMGTQLGQRTRLTLSHDLTFIALLLMSLYEPEERKTVSGCPVHPLEKRIWSTNEYVEYAADMNVALMYHKCLDDWNDDGNQLMHAGAKLLQGAYDQASQRWPRQCKALELGLSRISEIEKDQASGPDEAGNVFGMIMGELFVMKDDFWQDQLRAMGRHLGRFIYQMDAVCDLAKDRESGSYNPFANSALTAEDLHSLLTGYMADVTAVFEKLPLIQDAELLRSVLYAGIWSTYNKTFADKESGGAPWR